MHCGEGWTNDDMGRWMIRIAISVMLMSSMTCMCEILHRTMYYQKWKPWKWDWELKMVWLLNLAVILLMNLV